VINMTRDARRFRMLAILVVLGLPAISFAAQLSLSEPFPMIGSAVRIQIEGVEGGPEGFELSATFRPNSATERSVEVGVFGPDGGLFWTPVEEGITLLKAVRGEAVVQKNVAVKFASAPAAGIAMMLVAGTVLFGGIFVSIRRVLRT